MSTTKNLQLTLTPEDDKTTKFKDWRLSINGENNNSNMEKIDNAYGGLSALFEQLEARFDAMLGQLGDVSTALDGIIATEEGYIGG